jgi:Tfp pilus assembly protein PilZ
MLQQYDMTISKLVQLILNLSYIQRKALLKKGQQLFVRGTRSFRKSCQIPVKYSTFDRMYSDTIMNLSQGGAFVKTNRPIFIGEDILMHFNIEKTGETIKVKGEVIRASPTGIGIEFKDVNSKVAHGIKNFLKQN